MAPSTNTRPAEPAAASEQWRADAACANSPSADVFFPEDGSNGSTAAARKICAQCPVRKQCVSYAITNNEKYGIWGGLTANQIARIRRGRHPFNFDGTCIRGHKYSPNTTQIGPTGRRRCLVCAGTTTATRAA